MSLKCRNISEIYIDYSSNRKNEVGNKFTQKEPLAFKSQRYRVRLAL